MYPHRIICLCAFVFFATIAFPQTWADHFKQAEKSYNEGDYETALSSVQLSLSSFLKEPDQKTDNHAGILRIHQLIFYATNDYSNGLEFSKKEVALRETNESIEYGEALSQVGLFQQALEKYSDAEKSFRQSLAVLKHFIQPQELPIIECHLNIGISLYYQEKEEESFSELNETLTSYTQAHTPTSIQALYCLAQISFSKSDFENAIKSFQQVKIYYEQNEMSQSADYAGLLTSLGQASSQSGDLNSAEQYFLSSQKGYEALDEKTTAYYKLLNSRAFNLQKMGSPEKAEQLLSSIPATALTGELAATILSTRAMASASANDLASAAKSYREALTKLDKNNAAHASIYVDTQENLAMILSEQDNTTEALQALSEASFLVKGKPDKQIALSIKTGIVLLKAGDEASAKQSFKNALKLLAQTDKTKTVEWTMAMNGLGSVYTTLGKLESADSVYSALLTEYQEGRIKKDGNYPIVLNNYAAVKQMDGHITTSYNLFFDASRFLAKYSGENTMAYATALENLAQANINRGALTTAKGQIDTTLLIIEKTLGAKSLPFAAAQITLGKYYQHAGDFPSAEPCFKKANALLKDIPKITTSDQVRFTNAMALFYQTMGNYEEAEPLFKASIALVEKSGTRVTAEYSTSLQNLATLYQIQSKFDLAGPLLEKSLEIDEKVFGKNHPQYAVTLKNLGVLYQKQGNLSNAQTLLERALQVTENVYGLEHPSYAITVSNLAALYQDQGKYAQAEAAWLKSATLRKKILGDEHPDYARSLYGLANIYFANGNLEKSSEYFKIVTSQYLKQIKENFPYMSEKEKGAFYLKIKPVFEAFQDFCVQYVSKNQSSEKAAEILYLLYNIQLSTKAILLNASTKVRQQILATNNSETIGIYNDWLTLKETVGRYYTLTAEERKGLVDIGSLQEKANELEKKLSLASDIFKNQFKQQEVTAHDVQAALHDGEAAVEILRIRKKFKVDSIYYIALVLKKDLTTPSLVIWPNGARLEGRYFKQHRNAIKFMIDDTVSYTRFWKPLGKQLDGIHHVYVSSDGIFNKVNLATLQNAKSKRWVVDDFTLSLVSNTKEILERNSADQSLTKDVHLYGYIDFNLKMDDNHVATHKNSLTRNFGFEGDVPVLPGTEKEIKQINDLMLPAQWNVNVHMRASAKEESLKKIINPKILHIATHGFFMNDVDLTDTDDEASKFLNNPLLRSGLLFAGAGVREDNTDVSSTEDGILTAYEAMNLTLDHTDLVVMSACETGLGEIRNGEGVYGLQRSFLVAGASAVMMSLWQVDDAATQELMVKFYSNWMAGGTKLDAFRNAQLTMKEKYSSPYYWGAFIMVGY